MHQNDDNKEMYRNNTYTVVLNDERTVVLEQCEFKGGYDLVNNQTGIVEFFTPCLPEALRQAAMWDIAVNMEHHLWPYKQAANDAGEEGIVIASDDDGDLVIN